MSEEISRRIIIAATFSIIPIAALAQSAPSDPLGGLLNRIPGVRPGTGTGAGSTGTGLSQNEIGLGLKDALKIASQRVVGRVGKTDGYNGDPAIRIPLPDALQKIEGPLRAVGASGMIDDLHVKMNLRRNKQRPRH